jgi:hypothetical protein
MGPATRVTTPSSGEALGHCGAGEQRVSAQPPWPPCQEQCDGASDHDHDHDQIHGVVGVREWAVSGGSSTCTRGPIAAA